MTRLVAAFRCRRGALPWSHQSQRAAERSRRQAPRSGVGSRTLLSMLLLLRRPPQADPECPTPAGSQQAGRRRRLAFNRRSGMRHWVIILTSLLAVARPTIARDGQDTDWPGV